MLPRQGPGFVHRSRRKADARYGTVELVQALVQAAARVGRELPGGRLVVNDLSHRRGGPIAHHGSHQSGRDVDVLFYLTDPDGRPLPSVAAPIDPTGAGTDYKDLVDASDDVPLRLDVARTWLFVQSLIESAGSSLQRVFVVEHVRGLLLEHAKRVGAPRHVWQRFGQITCQPGFAHDDHMHLRFFCSAGDIRRGCKDAHPVYPWHRRRLSESGVRPVIARYDKAQRGAAADRTVSEEEARAAMGPMHPSVRAFLDWRESWVKRPHPGRPFCR